MPYRVTVLYVEPTYARYAGQRPVPRRWSIEIDAPDPPAAVHAALDRFHELSRLSGVGWIREVVSWDVTATPRAG